MSRRADLPYKIKEDEGDDFQKLVDDVKEAIKDVGKGHADLTARLDKYDKRFKEGAPADLQEQFDRQASEIARRVDAIDIASQRPRFEVDYGGSLPQEKEARAFAVERLSLVNKSDAPISEQAIEAAIDHEKLESYKEAFPRYLRRFASKAIDHGLTPEDSKAMQELIDPAGGYLAPPQMSARIIQRQFERDPMRALAGQESITSGAWIAIADVDDMDSGWEHEVETGSETATPSLRENKIAVHTCYAKPMATMNMVEDGSINIENWLAKKGADRFARREGIAFITGSGVTTPRGILDYPNGTSWGQIQQTAVGTVAGVIDTDGLIDVKYSLKEHFLNKGTWLMQRTTVSEVMQLKNAIGDYIWKPGLSAQDPYSTLIGQPVRMSPSMDAIAASSLSFCLADFREAYQIIDRIGISVLRDPYTKSPYILYYMRKRVGGSVVDTDAIKIGRVNP